jgi:hypothetical protein
MPKQKSVNSKASSSDLITSAKDVVVDKVNFVSKAEAKKAVGSNKSIEIEDSDKYIYNFSSRPLVIFSKGKKYIIPAKGKVLR